MITKAALIKGIQDQEFALFYQPKIRLSDKRIMGAEALLRWYHPQLGAIAPDAFLKIVHEENLHFEVTEFVIKTGLKQLKAWQDANLNLSLAINIPALLLSQDALYKTIINEIDRLKLDPKSLYLEITEQTDYHDLLVFKDKLVELCKSGLKLSIDDFGTGYSSILRLLDLPFSELKIDKNFIADMFQNEKHMTIVEIIIDIANKMKLTLCAEGIENQETENKLIEFGCQFGQGYYYYPALSAEDFLAAITT